MNYDIKIYNSLSNSVEEFKPIKENEISMYVCGPTVYNDIHIGNGRPVIFFDVIKRFFTYLGYKVKMVENFTDIDDKIIKKAHDEGVTEKEISERYIKAFLDVCDKAGCENDIVHPKVTENISEILDFIHQLVENKNAYISGDDVYFRVRSVPSYGILSNQRIDELESGARIDVNTQKEDPSDFTLWKKTNDEGRKWDSEFGSGRPGWHTECVVMIHKYLGQKIDIHGGGSDLKFPHHENEIAQSMALYHNTIANYWIHNSRIELKGEKMSKSLGNVVWLKDVLNKYSYQAYRLFILSNHYRQSVSYSDDLMASMENEWLKLRKTYVSLYRKLELENALEIKKASVEDMDNFIKEMCFDFNTANALTAIYDYLKVINKSMRDPNTTLDVLNREFNALNDMFYVFGLGVDIKPLTKDELELVKSWQKARKDKDFVKADLLRTEITSAGIEL